MEPGRDPTERFTDRVADYVRWRPGYPAAALDFVEREAGLRGGAVIADVGSGTGMLTEPLLARGHTVHAVEPNAAMRTAAEAWLGDRPRFHSVAGIAEATGLPAASVDLVTAAQAFHWFRPAETRQEWRRILVPRGHVALLWNSRRVDAPLLRDYEALLLEFGTDYARVDHRRVATPEGLSAFFGAPHRSARFVYEQTLPWEGLRGRLLSSSYVPAPGDPRHAPMLDRLRDMFDQHARAGTVTLTYDTEVHLGPLEHPRGTVPS